MQVARTHFIKCSTSLVTREMQIKTTLKFLLALVRMVITRNDKIGVSWGPYRKILYSWWVCKLKQ